MRILLRVLWPMSNNPIHISKVFIFLYVVNMYWCTLHVDYHGIIPVGQKSSAHSIVLYIYITSLSCMALLQQVQVINQDQIHYSGSNHKLPFAYSLNTWVPYSPLLLVLLYSCPSTKFLPGFPVLLLLLSLLYFLFLLYMSLLDFYLIFSHPSVLLVFSASLNCSPLSNPEFSFSLPFPLLLFCSLFVSPPSRHFSPLSTPVLAFLLPFSTLLLSPSLICSPLPSWALLQPTFFFHRKLQFGSS